MCAMLLTSYGWDLRNIAEIDQGTANCELFSIFSKTVDTIQTKFSLVILNHIEVLSKTPYDSNENIHSLFTVYGGPMCAMISTS